MASATQILHAAAGAPPYPATCGGSCSLCGATGAGVPLGEWLKPSFTNYDLLRPGDIICVACQFAADDNSALLQERTGKEKAQRMRNYSHFVVGDEWLPLHKGQKGEMLVALRACPAVAVIATSGQKHIAFRARPGWWQMEEARCLPDMERLEACIVHTAALYRVFSKGEIEAETWGPARMMKYATEYGMNALLEAQRALAPHRGTQAFALALFLTQKGDDDGPGDFPAGIHHGSAPADSDMAGAGRGLQNEIRAQHLAAIRGQREGSSLHEQPERLLQPTLFAADDSD